MKNVQNQPQRYIEIEGKQIAVTEEVYLAYKRPLWAEKKRQEREKRCWGKNGNRCMEDCSQCQRERTGSALSLDALSEHGFELSDSLGIPEGIEHDTLIRVLRTEIDALEPNNREIALLFASGLSEREIAARVGLSQRGVNKRKIKIFAELKRKLIKFT